MKPFSGLLSILLLLPLLAAADAAESPRQWTNAAGKTLSADLVRVDGDTAILRVDNGREYPVPLDSLSQEDQDYAREWQAEKVAIAEAPKPRTEPLMTTPGKVLYEEAFQQMPEGWRTPHGDWSAGEAGLTGVERPADDHAAVMKTAMPLQDVIIEFDVLLGESKRAMFGIDDARDHVCRVTLTPNSFEARKDDNDHEGPDVAKPFNVVSEEIDPDEWHTVRIELLGEEMLAQTDDHISLGRDPLLATEKAKWGFIVAGDTVGFRNLTIWEALPNDDWDRTGDRLRRRLDIDDE